MTTIDFNALMREAATAAAPLPIGDYDMVVVDAQAITASTGKPMYKVRMKVESGPHANRTMTNNFVLSVDNPNALRMFFRQMSCFGLDANFFAANPQPSMVAQALMGRRAKITLSLRKFQGEDRNEVQAVNPPGAGGALGGNGAVAPLGMPAQPMAPQAPAPMAPAPWQTEQPQPAPQPAPQPQPMPVPQPAPVQYEQPVPQPMPVPAPPQPQQYAPPPAPAPQPQPAAAPPIPPGWVQMPDGSIVPAQPVNVAPVAPPAEQPPAPPLPFG